MKKHPIRCFVNYLIIDLIQGFVTGLCFLPKVTHVCNNCQSALKEPGIVDKLLAKVDERGYMTRPYDDPPIIHFPYKPRGHSNMQISGKKHLILDFLAPHDGMYFLVRLTLGCHSSPSSSIPLLRHFVGSC